MNKSVLSDIKKVLGLFAEDTSFDQDVLLHINAAFVLLRQIGIPIPGDVYAYDDVLVWDQLEIPALLPAVKGYIYTYVRIQFDPPTSSFGLDSLRKTLDEWTWRLYCLSDDVVPQPSLHKTTLERDADD